MWQQSVKLVCIMLAAGIIACAGQLHARMKDTMERQTILWKSAFSQPPYEYLDPDGAMTGLAVEMGQALLKEMPYELLFGQTEGALGESLPPLRPDPDAAIEVGFESLVRQERLAASEPLLECRWGVYSQPRVTQALSWEKLGTFTLGVVGRQHPYYRLLKEGYTQIRVFERPEEAARALAAGEIDLGMTEKLTEHHALASLNALWPFFWIVLLAGCFGFAGRAMWWRRRYRRLESMMAQITDVFNKGKEKMQIAVANAQDGLFVFTNGSRPFLSEKLRELLLTAQATIVSMEDLILQIRGMAHPSYHGLLLALQEKVLRAIPFHKAMQIRLLKEGEPEYWIYLYIHAYQHQEGMVYTGYCRDVSKEKLLEQRLAFFEDHDHLTGLLNTRRIMQLGEQVLAQCAKTETMLAAIFLDLYHFKEVNHQYGQRYGDRILQQAATQIQEMLPQTSLLSRTGGDKFMILLSHMERRQDALDVVLQVLRGIQAIECRTLPLHANAGISFFPEHGDSVVHLITCAEKAADAAKEKGPGQYAVYKE